MPRKTREQKLAKQLLKAETCTTREEAQKIIEKAEKHRRKLKDDKG